MSVYKDVIEAADPAMSFSRLLHSPKLARSAELDLQGKTWDACGPAGCRDRLLGFLQKLFCFVVIFASVFSRNCALLPLAADGGSRGGQQAVE